MLKKYLKIAWRNIRRNKIYSIISITGLTIGMTSCIIVALFVNRELSFDRFHKNAQRIYRLCYSIKQQQYETELAISGSRAPRLIAAELPEIDTIVRLLWHYRQPIKVGNKIFRIDVHYADPDFFRVFSFPLLTGDPQIVLKDPNSVVITPELSERFFGREDPIGKTIQLEKTKQVLKVTGIMKNMPQNTHLKSDCIISFERAPESFMSICYAYLLFNSEIEKAEIEKKINKILEGMSDEKKTKLYFLQPLTSIYLAPKMGLDTDRHSDIKYSIFLSLLSLMILAISCINFINLSSARALSRLKEVGIRKVSGARRIELIKLFISESLLLSFIAAVFALLLSQIVLNQLAILSTDAFNLTMDFIENFAVYIIIFSIVVIVGFFTGSYPALLAASYHPVNIMKNQFSPKTRAGFFRKVLVIFQFAISAFFLIAVMVFMHQIHFIVNKDLGIRVANILLLDYAGDKSLSQRALIFKYRIQELVAVNNASLNFFSPGIDISWGEYVSPLDSEVEIKEKVPFIDVDEDYFKVFDIQLIEGRNFSPEYLSDKQNAVIINETAVRSFGWENPIGKRIRIGKDREFAVVGVVKDFHMESLRQPIRPYIFNNLNEMRGSMAVHIQPHNMDDTIEQIKKIWESIATDEPFTYRLYSDEIEYSYMREKLMMKIIGSVAVLTVVIGSLGLFGLVAFSAQKKVKEIGVRKVLGASAANIVMLQSKDFIKLVLIANLISLPFAYFAMNKWLQNFAYRVDISWWIFVLAGAFALFIALATVSTIAIRAALANPVKALRYE